MGWAIGTTRGSQCLEGQLGQWASAPVCSSPEAFKCLGSRAHNLDPVLPQVSRHLVSLGPILVVAMLLTLDEHAFDHLVRWRAVDLLQHVEHSMRNCAVCSAVTWRAYVLAGIENIVLCMLFLNFQPLPLLPSFIRQDLVSMSPLWAGRVALLS